MTAKPNHESLSPERAPITKLINDFYTQSYVLQMKGKNPIDVSKGLSGNVETIALDPKDKKIIGDNVRFIVTGGSLDFGGLSMDVGDKSLDVKHNIIKITLAPGDIRPIGELNPDQLSLVTMLFVNDEGEVSNGSEWFDEREVATLVSSMEACQLVPEIPEWLREHPDEEH